MIYPTEVAEHHRNMSNTPALKMPLWKQWGDRCHLLQTKKKELQKIHKKAWTQPSGDKKQFSSLHLQRTLPQPSRRLQVAVHFVHFVHYVLDVVQAASSIQGGPRFPDRYKWVFCTPINGLLMNGNWGEITPINCVITYYL